MISDGVRDYDVTEAVTGIGMYDYGSACERSIHVHSPKLFALVRDAGDPSLGFTPAKFKENMCTSEGKCTTADPVRGD